MSLIDFSRSHLKLFSATNPFCNNLKPRVLLKLNMWDSVIEKRKFSVAFQTIPYVFAVQCEHAVEHRFFPKFSTFFNLFCDFQSNLYKMSLSWSDENDILDLKELEKEIAQLVDKSYLEELLRLQLSEYEMLESMFPKSGELSVDDYSVLADIDDYINGKTSIAPPQLDYTICLNIDGHKLEVCVNLPLEYPNLEPDIFLRSEDLNRIQQRVINNALANYISELERGDICICSVISWLQENALEYFNNKTNESRETKSVKQEESFSRFWIYSHHIYSKIKRREILDLAHEFKLSGFCLPGRPGIICLEGYTSDCDEWWQRVRNMNWKKIMCKKIEQIKLQSNDIDKLRKFSDFREISFESGGGRKHDIHMDFGEFYKYLSSHQCEYIFKDYFGIDGK